LVPPKGKINVDIFNSSNFIEGIYVIQASTMDFKERIIQMTCIGFFIGFQYNEEGEIFTQIEKQFIAAGKDFAKGRELSLL
jgi:hypothetical protein